MKHLLTLSLLAILQVGWAQSEYCLDGTVWDAALGGCLPAPDCLLDSDLDGDGSVGSSDLLSFLSEFGGSLPDSDGDGICDNNDDCIGEVDACGVCNGPGAIFNCGCEECVEIANCGVISYQGYDYTTVVIGNQCWFAENLRSENYQNGDAIPSNLSDSEWQSMTSGAVAVYGEDDGCDNYSPNIFSCDPIQSLSEYGRLYNWFAVDDPRSLCPSGWHIPTDEEWMIMEMALGMSEMELNNEDYRGIQGIQLKTDYGWHNGGNGTNSSGFTGLPGGIRSTSGYFVYAGSRGYWWSSTPRESWAWYRSTIKNSVGVARYSNYLKKNGFSVRCVQDAE